MKIRRGLIVSALVGALMVGSAPPANAVYLEVVLLEMILFSNASDEEVLKVIAEIEASFTPFVSDGVAARSGDPATDACEQDRAGKLQRKVSGKWRSIKSARTNDAARFKFKVPAKEGTYRVLVPKTTPESTGVECFKGVSKPRTFKK